MFCLPSTTSSESAGVRQGRRVWLTSRRISLYGATFGLFFLILYGYQLYDSRWFHPGGKPLFIDFLDNFLKVTSFYSRVRQWEGSQTGAEMVQGVVAVGVALCLWKVWRSPVARSSKYAFLILGSLIAAFGWVWRRSQETSLPNG